MSEIKNFNEMLTTLNDVRQYLKIARADDCVEELDKVTKYLININLQPTEEEVLKEFEALGWKYKFFENSLKLLTLYKPTKEYIYQIDIYESKNYYFNFGLTIEEHQLLTKLFKAWNWL